MTILKKFHTHILFSSAKKGDSTCWSVIRIAVHLRVVFVHVQLYKINMVSNYMTLMNMTIVLHISWCLLLFCIKYFLFTGPQRLHESVVSVILSSTSNLPPININDVQHEEAREFFAEVSLTKN